VSNVYRISEEKHEENRPLVTPRLRYEDSIEMGIEEMGVNTVMKLRVT
jgi:hypothetical protein